MTDNHALQFKSVQDFLRHVQTELNANRLVLPTLPDIAMKVRIAVSKGMFSARELAEIIATDAALSARLMQIANSPLYRGSGEIKTIHMAVTRLGNSTIRTLVTSLVIQQMFKPSNSMLTDYFHKIWAHGVKVSAISRAISAFVPHLNTDEAMLAGLLHQIGKLPILTLVEKLPEFRDNPSRLDKLLEQAHPQVGKIIMDSWNFPQDLKLVASDYVDFQRDHPGPADYVDVVQVAFLQSIADTDHPVGLLDLTAAPPAFAKLGLQADAKIFEMEGVSEEIELAQSMLL
jgi:HD-like signal output (HDOD) protein